MARFSVEALGASVGHLSGSSSAFLTPSKFMESIAGILEGKLARPSSRVVRCPLRAFQTVVVQIGWIIGWIEYTQKTSSICKQDTFLE